MHCRVTRIVLIALGKEKLKPTLFYVVECSEWRAFKCVRSLNIVLFIHLIVITKVAIIIIRAF